MPLVRSLIQSIVTASERGCALGRPPRMLDRNAVHKHSCPHWIGNSWQRTCGVVQNPWWWTSKALSTLSHCKPSKEQCSGRSIFYLPIVI